MSISTVDKPEDKREKLKKLREFHQSTLDKLGASDALFIPKMAYRPYGKTDLHCGFFASELQKGEDIFTEFVSKDLVPEDPARRLYRWKHNPHFAEEYDTTEPTAGTGHVRYLIPVEELTMIKVEEDESTSDFDLPDPNQDLPIDQMTIRDLAAILLKQPVSQKKWLNELIKK